MRTSQSPASATLMFVVLVALSVLAGCGSPAAPLPPSLNLPRLVVNLVAERVGNIVTLRWTMPAGTTDGLGLRGTLDTELCRGVGPGPCAPLKKLQLKPGATAESADQLPPDLSTGSPRLLAYSVTVFNSKHRTAGGSKAIYVAAGAPPPTPAGLTATATKHGVVLHWQRSSDDPAAKELPEVAVKELLARREQVSAPGQPVSGAAPPSSAIAHSGTGKPAAEGGGVQTLRIPVAGGSGRRPYGAPQSALDATAVFGITYRYTMQSVSEQTLDTHPAKAMSVASQPVTITPVDKFPPARPTGLAAVLVSPAAQTAQTAQNPSLPGAQTDSVDLSWTPNTEPDLAGYRVYRKEAGTAGAPVRISPAAPAASSAFSDTNVQAGHSYVYAVTAVDQAGNESAPSEEQQQTVPSR